MISARQTWLTTDRPQITLAAAREPAGDLFWRPTLRQAVNDKGLKVNVILDNGRTALYPLT